MSDTTPIPDTHEPLREERNTGASEQATSKAVDAGEYARELWRGWTGETLDAEIEREIASTFMNAPDAFARFVQLTEKATLTSRPKKPTKLLSLARCLVFESEQREAKKRLHLVRNEAKQANIRAEREARARLAPASNAVVDDWTSAFPKLKNMSAMQAADLFPPHGRTIKSAINRRFASLLGNNPIDGRRLYNVLASLGSTDPQLFIDAMDRETLGVLGNSLSYAHLPALARRVAIFAAAERRMGAGA